MLRRVFSSSCVADLPPSFVCPDVLFQFRWWVVFWDLFKAKTDNGCGTNQALVYVQVRYSFVSFFASADLERPSGAEPEGRGSSSPDGTTHECLGPATTSASSPGAATPRQHAHAAATRPSDRSPQSSSVGDQRDRSWFVMLVKKRQFRFDSQAYARHRSCSCASGPITVHHATTARVAHATSSELRQSEWCAPESQRPPPDATSTGWHSRIYRTGSSTKPIATADGLGQFF